MPVLLVTYNQLNVTELDAKRIIGEVYTDVRTVVDAVEALSGGKKMKKRIIYHFNGMGLSAMISPPEIILNKKEDPVENSVDDRETKENVMTRVRPEADGDYRPEFLAAHSSVSYVCKSDVIVSAARRGTGWADADPPGANEWNLGAIQANGDPARKYTGKGIKIAILDTGIAPHEDLNVNGGVSFCQDEEDFRNDSFGHGTHCAGIVAGQKGGIAKEADLFSIKVADTTGAKPIAILAGLGWALRNRMNVVSISLAGPEDLKHIPAFANAVQALMRINCVVVASTGDGNHGVGLPANTPGIIAVGGCDGRHIILDSTNRGGKGNQMTAVAPAENITTTSHGKEGYVKMFDGSSAAAPHVAGLVALIQERFPDITPLQVITKILASGQPVTIRRNKEEISFGEMLIDCDKALSLEFFHK